MSRGAIACIDLSALNHNFSCIKKWVAHRPVLAMIKSNGYGHGLLRVARALNAADAFGVASLDEAIALRTAGIKQPLVVMAGFFDAKELPEFIHHDLSVVVHAPQQLETLQKTPLSKPLMTWLKIDTGMGRLGFPLGQVSSVYQQLQACASVKKPLHLMTHLSDADNKDSPVTKTQMSDFMRATKDLTGLKSMANSAGILLYREALLDWVRPGIMLYGVSPLPGRSGSDEGLKPVMTLTAKLISIKHLEKGSRIGYGGAWTCPEAMPVGIVGIGYGDGYPRHAKNGTPVLVNGVLCPLVGRVSMDMVAVDLRNQPKVAVGDSVTLWGNGLPVEIIADEAGTIGYELLCNVTSRVEFVEHGAE